jgi:hypothetical protein
MTQQSEWLINKVLSYLKAKEGCLVEKVLTDDEMLATIRDVFGYRYEISLKLVGRTQHSRELIQSNSLDFQEHKANNPTN